MAKFNTCGQCKKSLTRHVVNNEGVELLTIPGEAECCCGSLDEKNRYYDALCTECCGPHTDLPLHTGVGYYITSPRG